MLSRRCCLAHQSSLKASLGQGQLWVRRCGRPQPRPSEKLGFHSQAGVYQQRDAESTQDETRIFILIQSDGCVWTTSKCLELFQLAGWFTSTVIVNDNNLTMFCSITDGKWNSNTPQPPHCSQQQQGDEEGEKFPRLPYKIAQFCAIL